MYTRVVPRARELRPRHSVQNQWDLLEAIPGWTGGAADRTRDRDRDGARPGRRRADGGHGWRAAGVTADDELVVMHVSAGNPFRRWPEAFFAETAAALAAGNPRRRLVFSSGPSDREAASRIAADARGAARGRGRPYHRPWRIRPAGAQSADRPEPAVRRRRHGTAAHCRDHGHARRRHLRPDAGGALGPLAPAGGPDDLPRDAVADLPCRPCDQRVCVHGDFRCLTQLMPARVIAAAERRCLPPEAGSRRAAHGARTL